MFGRATITLGIGPHSSFFLHSTVESRKDVENFSTRYTAANGSFSGVTVVSAFCQLSSPKTSVVIATL